MTKPKSKPMTKPMTKPIFLDDYESCFRALHSRQDARSELLNTVMGFVHKLQVDDAAQMNELFVKVKDRHNISGTFLLGYHEGRFAAMPKTEKPE